MAKKHSTVGVSQYNLNMVVVDDDDDDDDKLTRILHGEACGLPPPERRATRIMTPHSR